MHRWWTVIVWCLQMGALSPALLAQTSAATPTPPKNWFFKEAKKKKGSLNFDPKWVFPSFSKKKKEKVKVSPEPSKSRQAFFLTKLLYRYVGASGSPFWASILKDIFLKDITLCHTTFFSHRRGTGNLDLTSAQVHGNLIINISSVVGKISLTTAKFYGYINLDNSSFSQEIIANGVNVVSIILTNSLVKGKISLLSAQISHLLNMDGLTIYQFMRWVVDTRNRRVIQGFRLWRSLDLDGGRPHADCGEHQRGTSAAVP